jgi:hypothetical protein
MNGGPMFPVFPGLVFGSTIPGTLYTLAYSQAAQGPATGILTSTGTAVNNITTATPFATGLLDANGTTRMLNGSMAGRTYLVTAVAAGSLMCCDSPIIGTPAYWTVALNSTIPSGRCNVPGYPVGSQ